MTVRGPAIPLPCSNRIFPGELVARYTYEANADSDSFAVGVVIGQLDSSHLDYDAMETGHVATVHRAASLMAPHSYLWARQGLSQISNPRSITDFSYERKMLLRGITAPDQVDHEVNILSNRLELEARGSRWQRTVIGLDALCIMHRALFVASGEIELNIMVSNRRLRSDSEIRADSLLTIGSLTLHAYTSMPPNPAQ